MPSGLMGAFSDPAGLSRILKEQLMERVDAAVFAHLELAHPENQRDVIVREVKQ